MGGLMYGRTAVRPYRRAPYPASARLRIPVQPGDARSVNWASVFDLIERELNEFEVRLARELESSVDFIEAIGEDLLRAGGKRLRPALAFLAGRVLRADPEASMRVALAVELLHSASLLHDDLIDDADTRRGNEAAFKRYGNVVSVMSGDYMLARVLGLLAELDCRDFTRLMSDTAARICEAEVLQFQVATLETYSFENYSRVIEGKTAVLLAAALEGVAILARARDEERAALRRYGMAYGRAFQMQDDYLDLFGAPGALGKPVGGDLREGKATYPVLLLLDAGVKEVRAVLRRHAGEDGDVERVVELARERGADVETRACIVQEAEEAIRVLAPFGEGPAKSALVRLAEREMERAR